jgi:hypothetical protein
VADVSESNEDLLARHGRVKDQYDKAHKQMEKLKHGPSRTRKAQWAGSLNFTLLSIESELRERGLMD